MRGIVSAAAYLPRGTVDGRRTAGSDEDGFTLGATALERLRDANGGSPAVARIQLVGDLPTTAEADLPRVLGASALVERFRGGAAGFSEAMESALDAARGPDAAVVVAVDLPSRGVRSTGAPPAPDPDSGIALLVGEGATVDAKALREQVSPDAAFATAAVFRVARAHVAAEPSVWVGDWDPTVGGAGPVTPPVSLPNEGPVSQGAYVPKARYLENLPSRWTFAAQKCPSCRTVTFPARGRCRQCGNQVGLETIRLPRDGGEVVASTVIGKGGQPTEFDAQVESSGPYGVVLVELAPGIRVTLQVADAEPGALRIGSRVATRLRRLYPMEGEWRYGRKAVPLG
jgi:uncharacterized OB-fold protein